MVQGVTCIDTRYHSTHTKLAGDLHMSQARVVFIRKTGKGTGVAPEGKVTVLDKNELKIGTEGQLELKSGHKDRQVVLFPADNVQRAKFES